MPSACVTNLARRPIHRLLRTRFVAGLTSPRSALLFAGILPPAWIGGVALLSLSKILENMEIGHNAHSRSI
jgi:hypothetical protein